MFLRFGKANEIELQKVIFSCVRAIFFVFNYTVSPTEDNSRDMVFKTLFKVFSILLSIFENLCFFIKR